jgi:hypothetical protein
MEEHFSFPIFDTIPREVICCIISFLSLTDVIKMRCINKKYLLIVDDYISKDTYIKKKMEDKKKIEKFLGIIDINFSEMLFLCKKIPQKTNEEYTEKIKKCLNNPLSRKNNMFFFTSNVINLGPYGLIIIMTEGTYFFFFLKEEMRKKPNGSEIIRENLESLGIKFVP